MAMEVPYGFCHCGCGEKTTVPVETHRTRDRVKGRPMRFVHGHHNRPSPQEYIEDPDTGCWLWQWGQNRQGYGKLHRDGQQLAHRWYYIQLRGPIPEGLVIDHLCLNKGCVNPDHMEPVTAAENALRGWEVRRKGPQTQLTLAVA